LLEKLKKNRKAAEYTVKLFEKLEYPQLKVDLELVSQKGDRIVSNKNESSPISDYKKDIEEEVRNYSTAKFGKYKRREVMVGALARLANLDIEKKSGLDYQNPFHNNLAQAIEILLYLDQIEETVGQLLKNGMDGAIIKKSENLQAPFVGIGAVEAPRGGLYHEFHFDDKGAITYANIITPTVQNLTSIEKSANTLLEQHKNKTNPEKKHLLEMLIRAYDPCITCSAH
jgi:sulfhydrogenase subunit alpha